MTKTHTADNQTLQAVQSAIRTTRQAGKVAEGISADHANKVLASNSLFELADALHLGRTATRRMLLEVASKLTRQIEQLTGGEVK